MSSDLRRILRKPLPFCLLAFAWLFHYLQSLPYHDSLALDLFVSFLGCLILGIPAWLMAWGIVRVCKWLLS
jgi:hypothetical protein